MNTLEMIQLFVPFSLYQDIPAVIFDGPALACVKEVVLRTAANVEVH